MIEPITLDELLSELERVSVPPDSGITIRELMDRTGRNLAHCREIVRRGIEVRKLRPARKTVTDISGRVTTVPSYVPI